MPCSPREMHMAMLRNLPEKTGHPLDHWLTVLAEAETTDQKQAIAVLKGAGLGHFQARAVYQHAQGQQPYADGDALLLAQFSPAQRATYAAFADYCRTLGDRVRAKPCRTYVPFYARRTFAIVQAQPDGSLAIGLALSPDAQAGLSAVESFAGSQRMTHQFVLADSGRPTGEQAAALRQAYELGK